MNLKKITHVDCGGYPGYMVDYWFKQGVKNPIFIDNVLSNKSSETQVSKKNIQKKFGIILEEPILRDDIMNYHISGDAFEVISQFENQQIEQFTTHYFLHYFSFETINNYFFLIRNKLSSTGILTITMPESLLFKGFVSLYDYVKPK